jgi:hypothetical protein
MVASPVTITVDALSTVMASQNIGEPPLVIRPSPVWTDPDDDRVAEAAAWSALGEIGWVDRRGRLDGEALDSLHILARPSIEYTAVFMAEGRQHNVVVAGQGDDMVMAYRDGQAVTISIARHQSLQETLLRQIPDARPAPVEALNIRLSELAGMRSDGELASRSGPYASGDARMVRLLIKRRLVGQGELYVGVRDHYGRRRRSAPVRYQDYKPGRVVVVLAGGYLSVAPVTKKQLLDRLHHARQGLTDTVNS